MEHGTPPLAYPLSYDVEYPDRPLDRLTSAFRIFTAIPIMIVLGAIGGGISVTTGGSTTTVAVAGGGALCWPPPPLVLSSPQETRRRSGRYPHQPLLPGPRRGARRPP